MYTCDLRRIDYISLYFFCVSDVWFCVNGFCPFLSLSVSSNFSCVRSCCSNFAWICIKRAWVHFKIQIYKKSGKTFKEVKNEHGKTLIVLFALITFVRQQIYAYSPVLMCGFSSSLLKSDPSVLCQFSKKKKDTPFLHYFIIIDNLFYCCVAYISTH